MLRFPRLKGERLLVGSNGAKRADDYIIHGKPFKEEKPSNPTSLRILFESRSRDLSEEQLTGDRLKERKVVF